MTHIVSNIHKTLSVVAAAMVLLMLATSCEHKDLYTRKQQKLLVKVHFDWSNLAPGDEKPEAMTLFFYSDIDGKMVRYDLPTDNDDNIIEIYSGFYKLISYNADDPGIASRFTDTLNLHDIMAQEANKEVPVMYGYNSDVDVLYIDTEAVGDDYEKQIIPVIPSVIYSNYNVIVKSADRVERAVSWYGTLSGLTNCIYAANYACSDKASEFYVKIPLAREENTCTGKQRTFGQLRNSETNDALNKLLLSIQTETKKMVYYLFDVTSQVTNASDPRNVTIIVDLADAEPLKPGDPDYPGDEQEEEGGIDAEVDEFGNENIDIHA